MKYGARIASHVSVMVRLLFLGIYVRTIFATLKKSHTIKNTGRRQILSAGRNNSDVQPLNHAQRKVTNRSLDRKLFPISKAIQHNPQTSKIIMNYLQLSKWKLLSVLFI